MSADGRAGVRCRDLGRMDYAACWELQRSLFDDLLARKQAGAPKNTVPDETEGMGPENTAAGEAATEATAGEAGAGDAAASETAAGNAGANETTASKTAAGEAGADDTTARETAANEAGANDTTAGETSAGEAGADDRTANKIAGITATGRTEAVTAPEIETENPPETVPETAPGEAGTILMVEHPPVYTLGKSGRAENLLVDRTALERLGARFFHIDRGGDITFHGPGQLVCYPILDLERLGIGLRRYIEALEEAVIRTVAHYGIRAGRIAGASGVWIGGAAADGKPANGTPENGTPCGGIPTAAGGTPAGAATATAKAATTAAEAVTSRPGPDSSGPAENAVPRKICAIGVRSSRYVTMHGFALNVATDLKWFTRINPCGFTDRGVTSIGRETGRSVPMSEVKDLVVKNLSEILNVKIYNY